MEINGIAHIQLTVNDLQRAMPFYEEVLAFMGMQAVVKNPEFLYMIGGRTAQPRWKSTGAGRPASSRIVERRSEPSEISRALSRDARERGL